MLRMLKIKDSQRELMDRRWSNEDIAFEVGVRTSTQQAQMFLTREELRYYCPCLMSEIGEEYILTLSKFE